MLSYRLDFRTADEVASEDPYGGSGVFLPLDLPDAHEILITVERAFGTIPAAAFPSRGAWVDLSAAGLGSDEAMTRWNQREALR